MLGAERKHLTNDRCEVVPCIIRGETFFHQLALNLGDIHGAAARIDEEAGRQAFRPDFPVEHRHHSGGIQHDITRVHAWQPHAVRRSTHRQEIRPA